MLMYLGLGFMGDQLANLTALSVTTALGIVLNRRFTFKSFEKGLRDYMGSGAVFLLSLAFTSLVLIFAPNFSLIANWPEVILVTCANLSASGIRFLLLRNWVFGRLKG